ncbi:unnamed protein product, partial [Ixodes hexagonus]
MTTECEDDGDGRGGDMGGAGGDEVTGVGTGLDERRHRLVKSVEQVLPREQLLNGGVDLRVQLAQVLKARDWLVHGFLKAVTRTASSTYPVIAQCLAQVPMAGILSIHQQVQQYAVFPRTLDVDPHPLGAAKSPGPSPTATAPFGRRLGRRRHRHLLFQRRRHIHPVAPPVSRR